MYKKILLTFCMLCFAFIGVTRASLVLKVNEQTVDTLDLGHCPIGAWTEPFHFTVTSDGPTYTINVIDFTPSDNLFTIAGKNLPFEVTPNNEVELEIRCNGTMAGFYERSIIFITEGGRNVQTWMVTAELYEPATADVVETAYNLGNISDNFFFGSYTDSITSGPIYNNYTFHFLIS